MSASWFLRSALLCEACWLGLSMGCMGTSSIDRNVGLGSNGGFEYGSDDRPTNWNVYHKALGRGKARMTLDKEDLHEGKQSLRFNVSSAGGRPGPGSPGVFQEMEVEPNRVYRVSWWLKNQQCSFRVNVNSHVEDVPAPAVVVLTEEGLGTDWAEYHTLCTTRDKETALHFELNVTGPGVLWVDDVQIQEVEGN